MNYSEIVATEFRFEIRHHGGLIHIAGMKENLIQGGVRDMPSCCQAPKGLPLHGSELMAEFDIRAALGDANAPWCPDCRTEFIQWRKEKKEVVQAHCDGKILAKLWLQEAGVQD